MSKDRWTVITGDEARALTDGGKWREKAPFWIRQDGQIWAVVDANLASWRERRALSDTSEAEKK